jgi:hypothetical protein
VDPFTDTNTPPLSISQVDSAIYVETEVGVPAAGREAADPLALREALLAAVVTRAGEVEAAEWVLDQAKAACDTQIAAALSAGLSAEKVAEAAGIDVSTLAGPVESPEPAPTEG